MDHPEHLITTDKTIILLKFHVHLWITDTLVDYNLFDNRKEPNWLKSEKFQTSVLRLNGLSGVSVEGKIMEIHFLVLDSASK